MLCGGIRSAEPSSSLAVHTVALPLVSPTRACRMCACACVRACSLSACVRVMPAGASDVLGSVWTQRGARDGGGHHCRPRQSSQLDLCQLTWSARVQVLVPLTVTGKCCQLNSLLLRVSLRLSGWQDPVTVTLTHTDRDGGLVLARISVSQPASVSLRALPGLAASDEPPKLVSILQRLTSSATVTTT